MRAAPAGRPPSVKIIMLTVFEDSDQVFKALSAGAFGYLVKSNRPAKLLQAIREVLTVARRCPATSRARSCNRFRNAQPSHGRTDTLTARELEVLQGLSCGHPYKQIASELGISLSTVRTYIQRIYEKLHVHSQTEAVMKYARRREDPSR